MFLTYIFSPNISRSQEMSFNIFQFLVRNITQGKQFFQSLNLGKIISRRINRQQTFFKFINSFREFTAKQKGHVFIFFLRYSKPISFKATMKISHKGTTHKSISRRPESRKTSPQFINQESHEKFILNRDNQKGKYKQNQPSHI